MRKVLHFCFLAIAVSMQAQDFKPYKVKSGKIVYERLKYSTHSGFSSVNGVETSYSKQVPYVAEQVVYYWDEFGDIAFEEIYQVSKFGGKPFPEKVKIAERLWIDEHRYYFNIEKNKVSDDPYHLRIKCKKNFQYYQIKDSWIETLYMGAESSEEKEVLGKKARYYRIDNYHDIYAWNGLVLKDESFSTRGSNGPRNTIERAKVAVEIDTIFKVKDTLFNQIWLKREKLYKSFDGNKINGLLDARQDLFIQADNTKGLALKKNDILLFVSTNYRLGKLQVLDINDKNKLTIKFKWYYNDNSVGSNRDSFRINSNSLVDIDVVATKDEISKEIDFKWGELQTIIPQNNIGIYLLKASRTNNLKLKPYVRN